MEIKLDPPASQLDSSEGIAREKGADRGKSDLENLWFLCCGDPAGSKKGSGNNYTRLQIVREQEYNDTATFKTCVQDILWQAPKQPEIIVLIVQSDTLYDVVSSGDNDTCTEKLGFDLKAPQLWSYHSCFSGDVENRTLDMRYDAGQANRRGKYEPSAAGTTRVYREMERRRNLIFFRYNLNTQRAICTLAERDQTSSVMGRDKATVESFQGLARMTASDPTWLHPFSAHLVIMYHVIETRKAILSKILETLLGIENLLLDGSLIAMRPTIEGFKGHIQTLHEISRSLITLEHSNENDIANINNMLRDLDRLSEQNQKISREEINDHQSEQRIKDGFLCLVNICNDRSRVVINRKQRAQNLIALLHNLAANHDSVTTIRIAQQNADIAKAARRDSASMSVIATLTMIYLPPTLVCGLFGTNFFGLDTHDGKHSGRPSLVVSDLWWIYPLASLGLTGITLFVWMIWKRRRVRPVDESCF